LSQFRGRVQVIVSYHNFEATPPLDSVINRVMRVQADAYKVVGTSVPRLDLPDQVHFVGRLEPAGAVLPSATSGQLSSRPLVLVTQGTHDVEPADLIQPALTGLADLEVDVIATSGRRGRTDAGVQPPANARVVDLIDFRRPSSPDRRLRDQRCGGVLASLAAGVPGGRPWGAPDKAEIAAWSRGYAGTTFVRVAPARCGRAAVRGADQPSSYSERARQIADY
jgi:hypothetical protein